MILKLNGSISKVSDAELQAEFDKVQAQVEEWGLLAVLCALGQHFDKHGFPEYGDLMLLLTNDIAKRANEQAVQQDKKVSNLN